MREEPTRSRFLPFKDTNVSDDPGRNPYAKSGSINSLNYEVAHELWVKMAQIH
jgi:hypothetical protein